MAAETTWLLQDNLTPLMLRELELRDMVIATGNQKVGLGKTPQY